MIVNGQCPYLWIDRELYLFCNNLDIERVPFDEAKFNFMYLDFSGCKKLRLVKEDFEGWVSAKQIILRNISMDHQRGKVAMNVFSDLPVTIMEFQSAGLTDQENWILPKTLGYYNVSENRYTRLDVSMCPVIEAIIAENNKLKNIPKLFHPSKIRTLILQGNPLDELTVNDLAPLCSLSKFYITLPSSSYLLTSSASCECKRLNLWIERFIKMHKPSLLCADPSWFGYLWECDLSMSEMKALRKNCTDVNDLPLPFIRSWKKVVIRIFLVLFLSLLFLITLYILYKVQKKSFEEEEDPIKSQDRDPNTEDNEEEEDVEAE